MTSVDLMLEEHRLIERMLKTPEADATLRAQMDAVDRARALEVGVARYPALVAEFEEALLKC
jgi:hypothetical protein